MNYQETIDYLYSKLPVFHRIGAKAFKPNLNNTLALCSYLDNPHLKFKSIHVAGTNGKGSSSHLLASVFQEAGYKTGLYTSPHLKSFTERIKVNGKQIAETEVCSFVAKHKTYIEELAPSFFELTVGMAFDYFAAQQVDIAIIEVGLGGRLDSTNIILPECCLITNISFDHTDILGDTLPKIATEKAGIIKPETPVVVAERQETVASVFIDKAVSVDAPIFFAEDHWQISHEKISSEGQLLNILEEGRSEAQFTLPLLGKYQQKNLLGVLEVCRVMYQKGWTQLSENRIQLATKNIFSNTGFIGRWQTIHKSPLTVCDVAHNESGMVEVVKMLATISYNHLWVILGMVKDKDISKVLALLPKEATYIFCEANIPRAMPVLELSQLANTFNLHGQCICNVNDAITYTQQHAMLQDLILITGSNFTVAEIKGL
jgi:dihydrofolate synthase / folylpolyglutamate synthase